MEEFMEEFVDHIVVRTIKTCSNHYWVESEKQDDNSELLSVNCLHCPIGANIDPKKFEVKDGKICSV